MFKLIERLGKLVVKMYFREATKLVAESKEFAKAAKFHAAAADKALKESVESSNEAAKVAAKAQKLKELF